jgi:uncharacterized membrane protein (UPF0182 family)
MPELKRVILSYKNEIVMESTLESGLRSIFGGGKSGFTSSSVSNTSQKEESGMQKILKLSNLADETMRKADSAIKAGNWKEYGELQEELRQLIQELNRNIIAQGKKQ